jgi:hypothetical protein
MENQHRLIKGYRELTEEEIAVMNEIKEKGAEFEELIQRLYQGLGTRLVGYVDSNELESERWINLGKDHIQQGLMALTRAVARPDFF